METPHPARSAAKVADVSLRVLPAEYRERYRAELRSELYDIATSGASKSVQLIYALRLMLHAPRLRWELQKPGWLNVKVGITCGTGVGGGAWSILAGWSGVLDLAILTAGGTGTLIYVLADTARTERMTTMITTVVDSVRKFRKK